MRPLLAALALSCIAGNTVAAPQPAELLQPMAFLAGHCWRGTFADGRQVDEHCFEWLYDGRALRDVHTVRSPSRPDAIGETTYYVNSAANRVEFLYVENAGGFSRGSVEPLPDSLLFPDTQYIADGEALVYRARWTRRGDDAYEAWSEAQTPEGWSTMYRLTMHLVR